MEIALPYPPSVNKIWRQSRGRMILSREARQYRAVVARLLAEAGVQRLECRISLTVEIYPPDKRKRDLDNVLKALLDALQHGGAYYDDSQIDELHVIRGEKESGGMVYVQALACSNEPQRICETEESNLRPARRKCLKCDKMFASSGPGNRICHHCSRADRHVRITEKQLQAQRGRKRHFQPPFSAGMG